MEDGQMTHLLAFDDRELSTLLGQRTPRNPEDHGL
jgi:hypothetical protein